MPGHVLALRPRALDLGGIDGARPAEPLGDAGTEARVVRVDPGAVPAADLVALQNAENSGPRRGVAGVDPDLAMIRKKLRFVNLRVACPWRSERLLYPSSPIRLRAQSAGDRRNDVTIGLITSGRASGAM